MPRAFFVRLAILSLCAAVAGCGFHLRGAAALPFQSILITSRSPLGLELARNIAAASNAKVVTAGDADAVFDLIGEQRDKVIVSLDTTGQPREYQLRYRVSYDVRNPKGGLYIAPNTLTLRREITFNNQVLAAEYQDQLLYQDMQTDAVQQILRRMQASKLHTPDA